MILFVAVLFLSAFAYADTVEWQSGNVWDDCMVLSAKTIDGATPAIRVRKDGQAKWLAGAKAVTLGRSNPSLEQAIKSMGISVSAPAPADGAHSQPDRAYGSSGLSAGSGSYWLNTKTGKRHNSGCRYYGDTKSGRECSANEGTACRICGG